MITNGTNDTIRGVLCHEMKANKFGLSAPTNKQNLNENLNIVYHPVEYTNIA